MRNIDNILDNYYNNNCNEDTRLTKNKSSQIEYLTTTKYINKYLKQGDKILEIGAGTGAYSLTYASIGYNVSSLELVNKNVEIMKSKVTDKMNIDIIEGNALDLSYYQDNTYDLTLSLGPLYHLFKEEEIKKSIEETIRVTKLGGKMFFAFTLFDLTMLTWGFQEKKLYNNYGNDKLVSDAFKPINKEDNIFNMSYFEDIKKLMNTFNIKILHYVATDGLARLIKNDINNMNEEEYEMYLKYHYSICEREDLIGYSGHVLVVAEKE